MNRRPAGPLSARASGRADGAFSRGSGQLPLLGAVGVLMLIVVVGIIVLASRCGSAAADPDCSASPPPPPSGFSYASKYCVNHTKIGKTVAFQSVPLTDRSSTRGLSLFTYAGGAWKRLAPLQVSSDGTAAGSSAPLAEPRTFAVLRNSGEGQVFAVLPRGAQLSGDALRLATSVVPAVYVPAADGSIAGGPVTAVPGAQSQTMPEISAEDMNSPEGQAVNAILADDNLRNTHVDRIASEADRGGWSGVEIDYTAVNASLKSNFSTFVAALSTRLRNSKRQLVLRLPLPSHVGNDWNGGAYDWAVLSKSADVLVMAAEYDQSIYRTRVTDAVKYLVTQVGDSRKLVLELTPLSEQKSETGDLTRMTTLQALSIAGQITVRDPDTAFVDSDVVVSADNINRDSGSGLQWTLQGVLSFSYSTGTEQRTVWVENQFSAGYKLEIVQLYKLGGVQVDNASGDPAIANLWPAIDQFEASGQPLLEQPYPQTLRPQWLEDNKPIQDAPNRAVITWHTPTTPGQHLLAVIVGDGVMSVINTASIDVKALPPGGRPSPTAGASPGRPAPSATRGASPTRAPTRAPTVQGR